MMLARIVAELRAQGDTAQAEAAAREGFMRWVLSLPPGVPTAAAARAARVRVRPLAECSQAVACFLDCLEEAVAAAPRRSVRRGGARARRHAQERKG